MMDKKYFQSIIRPMCVEDLDAVLALELKAHISPWSRENFSTSIASGYLCWCIDDIHQEICAYCVLMPSVDELHILNITVAIPYQRQGYAHYFLDTACGFAQQHAIEKLLLEVRPSNIAALSLYQQYGFKEIGRRPNYYFEPILGRETAIVMAYLLENITAT